MDHAEGRTMRAADYHHTKGGKYPKAPLKMQCEKRKEQSHGEYAINAKMSQNASFMSTPSASPLSVKVLKPSHPFEMFFIHYYPILDNGVSSTMSTQKIFF